MMCQVFGFDSYCRAIFGGRCSIFQVKSQQEGCYSGCVKWISEFIASYSIFVGVQGCLFIASAMKCLVTA